ncbi:hypothetical protein L7F22_043181 [Adiantum nelumboides]|nr:hypothetical protein [Adiantum nelumboides]
MGLIGKFGQVPLSDICAFVELPDGKVLSGTETGMVLVWDGGLIKCQLRRPGGMPCHNGMIEFLQLDEKENEMLTAGADGCVRFWSLQWLDAADDGDEKTVCEVNPLRELHVDDRCSIKGIIVSEDHWLIQDENGVLWKVHVPSFEVEKLFEFHAGFITGLSVSPNNHFLATSGSDYSVRLFHFEEKQQVYARWFANGATSILWPSKLVDPHCRTVIAGFADGIIRILSKGNRQWRLINAQKPHTSQRLQFCN